MPLPSCQLLYQPPVVRPHRTQGEAIPFLTPSRGLWGVHRTPSAWATEGSEPAHGTLAMGLLCPPSNSKTEKMKTVLALCLGQNSCRFTCCPGGDPHLGASHLTVSVGKKLSKKLESKGEIRTCMLSTHVGPSIRASGSSPLELTASPFFPPLPPP